MGVAKGVKGVVAKQTTKKVTNVVDGLAKRGERTAVGCIGLCNGAQMTIHGQWRTDDHGRTGCIHHHRTPQHPNIHDKLGMRGEVVSSKPNKLAL